MKGFKDSPISDFDMLFDLPEWCYLSEDVDNEKYSFIVHKTCPKGLHIKVEGSVMNYYSKKCQQCRTRPPDEMLGIYTLYRWGINGTFEQLEDKP